MSFSDKLRAQALSVGVELDEEALDRFRIYFDMLIDCNTRMNLTAITAEDEVITKHFCDSLCILGKFNIPEGAKVIDVGTGAGFPGIPLLIARPDLRITLLDSLNKRLLFLCDVLRELSLTAEIVHSRAEEGAMLPKFREKFDIATSRAVARQTILCEYCLPYVKVGGSFISMKGPGAADEMKDAKNAIKLLGGEVHSTAEYTLADSSIRTLIDIGKIAPTPSKYPRHNSKIKAKPL